MMVALILDTAALFICISIVAKLLLLPVPVGLRSRSEVEDKFVGGRAETQSWTRRLTLGFWRRLIVFLDDGFEVIITRGPEGGSWVGVVGEEEGGKGCEGR